MKRVKRVLEGSGSSGGYNTTFQCLAFTKLIVVSCFVCKCGTKVVSWKYMVLAGGGGGSSGKR